MLLHAQNIILLNPTHKSANPRLIISPRMGAGAAIQIQYGDSVLFRRENSRIRYFTILLVAIAATSS